MSKSTNKSLCAILSVVIPTFIINIGIAIYATIVLATNSKESVSTEIYAFILIQCILHFITGMVGMCYICNEGKKVMNNLSLLSTGSFIWACVILFAKNGVDYKSTNPYYMFVFVYFLIGIILLGIIIVMMPFICGCVCYNIDKADDEKRARIDSTELAEVMNQFELNMTRFNQLNAMKTATAPTTETSTNITTATATAPTITSSDVDITI